MIGSEKIRSVIGRIPCLGISFLPTPLHLLPSISGETGAQVYCKRDDLTGFALGGNKTRKLDYLLKEALDRGHDQVVTFGSNQSNWCRMTAAACSANGLGAHLVLAGEKPARPTANLLLDHLAGAVISHLDTEEEGLLVLECERVMERLRKEGFRPFYIPVGGSVPTGVLGYTRAFMEILEFSESTGVEFSDIFVASGSAGTQAGLVVGQLLSGWEGRITGIAVSRTANEQEEIVYKLCLETMNLLDQRSPDDILRKMVVADDSYMGGGYRVNTVASQEAIRRFAACEGIFLDEVYTGKAAAGMLDYLNRGKAGRNKPVLFLHTGGSIQLFE